VADAVDAVEAADAAVPAGDPPVQPEPAGGNGDVPATTGGRGAQVVEALAALAPADRVAVVLVDREGFAPEAAARILGLTPEIVQARLVGARARLTNQLADVPAVPTTPAQEEDEPESQPEEAEPEAETEAQSEEPQSASEQPEPEPDDATSADPADTKVASRSATSGSPNGSSGAARTNGSDDGGGGAS
jgi:hypothetical protein